MTYSVNYSNILKNPIVVADGSVNNDTSLNLVGKNSSNYGKLFAENFVHLLENSANLTSPSSPIEGQLWYDVSAPTSKILKVYDGANWVPVNGVHQTSTTPPSKRIGDIWVDTTSRQLNIWNGYEWLLIGPTSSTGLKNGVYPTRLLDNLGDAAAYHNVILSYINDDVITIVSKEAFTPNPLISGFTALVPGLNVSTKQFGGSTARLGGLADVALSLKVTNSVDPIAADYFLRSDTAGTISGFLNVDSNSGIRIGYINQTVRLEKNVNNAILSNRTNGGNIGLSVLKSNVLNEIVTVDGNYLRVGINNISPTVALDVTGSGKISGAFTVAGVTKISNSTQSNSTNTGALQIAGGVGIGRKLVVGDDTFINGQLYINYVDVTDTPITGPAIVANTGHVYDIGTSDSPFKSVYADEFITTNVSFSMVPTGAVLLYSGGSPPDGWLICDGSSVEKTAYPRLLGAISTAYGSTDGDHFNIPLLTALAATNPNVTLSLNYIIKY